MRKSYKQTLVGLSTQHDAKLYNIEFGLSFKILYMQQSFISHPYT